MPTKIVGHELEDYKKLWKDATDDPWDFELYYDYKKCNSRTGILGYFQLLTPKKIYIMDVRYEKIEIVPTIVHENTHRKQLKRYGLLLYSLLMLPLIRNKLEKEAREAENEAGYRLNLASYNIFSTWG